MKTFGRIALVSTAATYILIFIGGLVRVAGAGMGCPDWPKCFGRWIPPLSISQIPPGIDAASFNITLAWIEYINRLAGMTLGLLIVTTALFALIRARNIPRLLYPTLAAALLVAVEGWQGSQVIASELQPIVVSAHLLIALIIASLLTYVTQEVYYLNRSLPGAKSKYPGRARVWVGLLWLGGIVQVVLGTQVRSSAETIAEQLPLLSPVALLSRVGGVHSLHMLIGIGLALFTIFVALSLWKTSRMPSLLVKQSIIGLILLAISQLVLGFSMLFTGLAAMLQLFHLWLSALYIGLVLILYSAMRRGSEHLAERAPAMRRLALVSFAIISFLALVGFTVVKRADASRANISVIINLPDFNFIAQTGELFGLDQLKGKLTVVNFFFTSCQGICPGMAVAMGNLYDRYSHSDKVQFISISVDPEIDTQERLQEYARELGVTDARWKFLRTDIQSVKRLARNGFLVSDEFPGMHSTRLILVDNAGRVRGYYEYSDETAQKTLRRHIRALSKSM